MSWMQPGHTAVVTGGASGIGLAAAVRFAEAGMNVLLVDIDGDALKDAAGAVSAALHPDAQVLVHHGDITRPDDLQRARDRAYAELGAVHCLMNNAGIARPATVPWDDRGVLEQTLAVNLHGVIEGCRAFVPAMLDGGQPGVIVNTGSKQGITRPPGNWAYNLSKAAVLAYTESVAHALRTLPDCRLTAHLLIPGFVYTGMVRRFVPEKPAWAWTAQQTVDFMLPCLLRGDFYILCPDGETPRALDQRRIQWTADDLIHNRPALSRWHPDFADAFRAFAAEADDNG